MSKKISGDEITAAAQNATQKRNLANDAKKAADDAGGLEEALNTKATQADKEAKEAEAASADLSQKFDEQKKAVTKMLVKRADIDRTLKELGEEDDAEVDGDDDEDPLADPTRVLTAGDFKRIEANRAKGTLKQLVAGIGDATERAAVQSALDTQINPALIASDPQAAFNAARSIANTSRNSKIIEDAQRRQKPTNRGNGSGAPPNVQEPFEPTVEERKFMRGPMALTEAQIIAARGE